MGKNRWVWAVAGAIVMALAVFAAMVSRDRAIGPDDIEGIAARDQAILETQRPAITALRAEMERGLSETHPAPGSRPADGILRARAAHRQAPDDLPQRLAPAASFRGPDAEQKPTDTLRSPFVVKANPDVLARLGVELEPR